MYRESVKDFNAYENFVGSGLKAEFYYLREQAEVNGKMYQQALNDIETAIYLSPENPVYYIEKAMLCYRVKMSDEGIRTLEKAKELAPGSSDVYYLLGRLNVQKENFSSAKECFEKALSLGHPDAGKQLESLK
jgi:tetratricopeptide (TPR) repeat protein